MIDAYEFYCQWQRERNRAIPTREQWEAWCAAPRVWRDATGRDLDKEREAREGWGE